MAVALEITLAGATIVDYEGIMQELGLPLHADGPNWPDGAVSHVAGETPDGLFVIDIWDSRAQFDVFVEGRLGPAMGKVGITAQPQVREIPLYNVWSRGRS